MSAIEGMQQSCSICASKKTVGSGLFGERYASDKGRVLHQTIRGGERGGLSRGGGA